MLGEPTARLVDIGLRSEAAVTPETAAALFGLAHSPPRDAGPDDEQLANFDEWLTWLWAMAKERFGGGNPRELSKRVGSWLDHCPLVSPLAAELAAKPENSKPEKRKKKG